MIESKRKALIGGIQKFSTEDGPGIRTTVFLKGCPLDCKWCHNPELIDFSQQLIRMPNSCIKCGYCLEHCPKDAIYLDEDLKVEIDRKKCDLCMECTRFCYANALKGVSQEMTCEEIMYQVCQDKDFYQETGGGMTLSGGEILSQSEFCQELIEAAAKEGINVCLDTSGYGSERELVKLAKNSNVTEILFDIKSVDDRIHIEYTSKSNKVILENLRILAGDEQIRPKLHMRMPLISNINDGWEIIERTLDLYKGLSIKRLSLIAYHDLGVSKMRNIGGHEESFSAPSDDYILEIKRYFEEKGDMQVEILGKL